MARVEIKPEVDLTLRAFIRFLFAAAFLLCTYVSAGLAQSEADSLAAYRQALQIAEVAGRSQALEMVVQKWPNFTRARYGLGAEYYKLKRFAEAIPHFEYILAHDSTLAARVKLKRLLAVTYSEVGAQEIRTGSAAKAVTYLQKAVNLDTTLALAYYNLGNAYHRLGDYEAAVAAYKTAIQLEPDSPEILATFWYNLGVSQYANGNFVGALSAYEQALVLNPDLEPAEKNLLRVQRKLVYERKLAAADSALALGEVADAATLANEALRVDSTDTRARDILHRVAIERAYQRMLQAVIFEDYESAKAAGARVPAGYKASDSLRGVIESELAELREAEALQRLYDLALKYYYTAEYQQAREYFRAIAEKNANYLQTTRYLQQIDSLLALPQKAGGQIAAKVTGADSLIAQQKPVEMQAPGRVDTTQGELLASRNVPLPATAMEESSKARIAGLQKEDGWRSIVLWIAIGVLIVGLTGYIVQKRRSAPAIDEEVKTVKSILDQDAEEADSDAGPGEVTEATSTTNLMRIREGVSEELLHETFNDEQSEITTDEAGDGEDDDVTAPAEVSGDLRGIVNDEDFLAIVNGEDENKAAGDTGAAEEEELPEKDATHTMDISQIQVRKIGRYVIDREIGRGAAGRVYKAWDPKLDRTVVLKTVSYSLTASKGEIQRLKARVHREAKTAAKLNHPNIVVVYDVEDEPSFSYIVMEHIEGQNLRQLLDQQKKLAPSVAIAYVQQVGQALQFAHKEGIIHRDIKPSNIIVLENEKIKVTDFGIAKVINNLTLTQTGKVVGTPSYMAPEQIEGHEIDNRADIFSLGVVFYELLTGTRPFAGESLASLAYKIVHVEPTPPSLVNVELSEAYDDIISQALAKDPQDRFQSAAEFLDSLQKAIVELSS